MQTASTEIYTLSLHDALPISSASCARLGWGPAVPPDPCSTDGAGPVGRHRPAGPAPFPQTSPTLTLSEGGASHVPTGLDRKGLLCDTLRLEGGEREHDQSCIPREGTTTRP